MAIQHTITNPAVASARLFGGTWQANRPGYLVVSAGMDGSTQHYAFFRFGDIEIPPYARIVSAQFRFWVYNATRDANWYFAVSGVKDNGTLWTGSARNGAGRDTTATGSVLMGIPGKWYTANIVSIAEAWRDGLMDPTRGICITRAPDGNSTYKQIGGWDHYNPPTLTIVYEIPASVPVPNASQVEIGQSLTVNLVGVEPGVTHMVRYKIGETLLAEHDIGAGTTDTYTVPITAGEYFPTAITGMLTVEVETYDEDEVSRGTVDASVVLTLPEDKLPTVTADLSRVWVDGVAEGSKIGAYVQAKSGVRAQLTATPKYGATIAGYVTTCEGKTYSGDDITHKPFTGSGSIGVHYYAIDSRGVLSATTTQTLTVLPWQAPQIQQFMVRRVDASGNPANDGTRVKIALKATVSSLMVGDDEQNGIMYIVGYRQIVAAGQPVNPWQYADAVVLDAVTADEAVVIESGGVEIDEFSDLAGYDFLISVADIYAASTLSAQIPTSRTIIDINTADSSVEFGGDVTIKGNALDADGNDLGLDRYSTDPVVVGKWIDGRAIYRKVLTFGAVAANAYTDMPIAAGGQIGEIVRLWGGGYTGSNYYALPSAHYNSLTGQIQLAVYELDGSAPYIRVRTGSSGGVALERGFAVIEYTLAG